ncbi:AraC family transcriptional regulator [soil metagenome]
MIDKLSSLLPRFGFSSTVFYSGSFCGLTTFCRDERVGHLHLVRSGELVMEHDDATRLVIKQPSLVFYPRPFNHRLVVPPASQVELLCATVIFKEAPRNPFSAVLPDFLVISLDQIVGLSATLLLLFEEAGGSDIGKKLVLDRLCDVVIVQLLRHAVTKGQIQFGVLAGMSDAGIGCALFAILEDPARPWRLDQLASLAGMSRSKFAKYFQEVVGVTPAMYLTDSRMAMAASLLREDKMVKSVAVAVGYGSQPAFTKAFNAKFGMSPTEWLRVTHP